MDIDDVSIAPDLPCFEYRIMKPPNHCGAISVSTSLCLYKKILTVKFLFLITIILIWVQFRSTPNKQIINQSLLKDALKNITKESQNSNTSEYRNTDTLLEDLKYMLLWTRNDVAPLTLFENGQRTFIKKNCSMKNCYVTSDRNYFNGDITKFDAIAFNGRSLKRSDLPKLRSPRQKYIFFNMESAENYPVCNKVFDGFFNWTATYKLNSDIPFTYIIIKDNKREVIGPKLQMQWTKNLPELEEEFVERLSNKSKAAAWFVSHCFVRSERNQLVKDLQMALSGFGLTVDVYGSCGQMRCPRNKKEFCNLLLKKYYFFYLSLENSLIEDYITEKVLTALQHDAVPIVFGGADYNRFLPPNSYINARKFKIPKLAAIMASLIKTPVIYRQFFKWKSRYTYSDPTQIENVCAVCAALNNKKMLEKQTVYHNFRSWWNPKYKERCFAT